MRRPVLVVGLPRSGTTWTESVLGTAVGMTTVSEPDNEKLSAPAISAKRGIGRFPVLGPNDVSPPYERLWRWALSGAPSSKRLRAAKRLLDRAKPEEAEDLVNGRLSPELRLAGLLGTYPGSAQATRTVIAKSVHACLSVEWIAAHFDVDVLVVLRHPANVLASWLELDLPDRDRDLGRHARVRSRYLEDWGVPGAGSSTVERAAWQLGLLTAALEQSAQAHPKWIVRTHEHICSDPDAEFRRIFSDLGLVWSPATSDLLESSDRPGSGFSLNREAALLADSWRSRLKAEQIDTLRGVLRLFPLKSWDLEDSSTGSDGHLGWLSTRVPPHAVRPPDQS